MSARILHIPAFAVFVLLAVPALAQNSDETVVTVDYRVDTEYDDSPGSLEQLGEFLDLGFFESAQAQDRAALDEYLFTRYEFGPSQLPAAFDLLRRSIDAANRNHRPGEPWWIPAIPRRRKTKLNAENPYYDLPRVAEFHTVGIGPEGLRIEQEIPTHEEQRVGAKYTILHITMPRSFFLAHEDQLTRGPFVRISRDFVTGTSQEISAPIDIPRVDMTTSPPYASTTATSIQSVPETEATTLREVATETVVATASTNTSEMGPEYVPPLDGAIRHTYLLVIDDGWPTPEDRAESLSFFENVINRLRDRFALPHVSLAAPSVDVTQEHAVNIALAISTYTTADTAQAVHVLYLPTELSNATRALYEELFTVSYLLADQNQTLPPKPARLVAPLLPAARGHAKTGIALWEEAIARVDAPTDFRIDSEALNAIYAVLDEVSRSENTAFVVNASWTTRSRLLAFAPTDRSLTVAAAGNSGIDVFTTPVDLAHRCSQDNHVLTVMVVDKDGPACNSSKVSEDRIESANVVSFNGEIPGDCETSYATPRVAWLLAARLATLQTSFDEFWLKDFQERIKKARAGGTSWHSVVLLPQRLW